MAERKTYKEMLLDPRWQKKRLKVLEAAEWKCDVCGEAGRTLHVHHLEYWPSLAPWEYPDNWLAVLCADCHSETTAESKEERATQLAEGQEIDLHKRVFGLFSLLGTPSYAEELLRELAMLQDVLRRAADPVPTDVVLWAFQTGGVAVVLADACRSWRAEVSGPPGPRAPFESHLLRAMKKAAGEE